jgi:ABC-type uncharacterized transport system permease subunit
VSAVRVGPVVLERRALPSRLTMVAVRALAVLTALLFGAAILTATGYSASESYRTMWLGTFGGGVQGIAETLVAATPLILTGLAVAVAARMLLWNIGAEGQLFLGATFASALALNFAGWPRPLLLTGMVIAAAVGGAAWALGPALLRVRFGVNEIITTLMLNYVAILLVDYLVHGAWRDPGSSGFPLSKPFGESATLPVIVAETRLHAGFVLALAAATVLWIMLRNTRFGYEVRAIGESPAAARYAGMPTGRNVVAVMLLSGALAGLAGMGEVAGIVHRIQPDISVAYGYTGILVAALARFSPPGVVLVGILFGALQVGGFSLQTAGAPASIVGILMGSILFVAIGAEFLARFRVGWNRAPDELAAEERRKIAREVEAR